MFEFVFGALVNNDSVGATANDFIDRDFPGAEHAFPQEGNANGSHHKRAELACLDIEGEAQDAAERLPRFSDYLAVDDPAVTVWRKGLAERVCGINKDHIAHLANAIKGHPTGESR